MCLGNITLNGINLSWFGLFKRILTNVTATLASQSPRPPDESKAENCTIPIQLKVLLFASAGESAVPDTGTVAGVSLMMVSNTWRVEQCMF